MKNAILIPLALVAIVGCTGADTGSEIPVQQPAPTADQVQSMPPEAQKAMTDAQKAGDFQSKRMAEMAAAQRAAGNK